MQNRPFLTVSVLNQKAARRSDGRVITSLDPSGGVCHRGKKTYVRFVVSIWQSTIVNAEAIGGRESNEKGGRVGTGAAGQTNGRKKDK